MHLCERAKEACDFYRYLDDRKRDQSRDTIHHALQELENGHDLDWVSDLLALKRNLQGFWTDVRDVNTLFKECKPLRREDREELQKWMDHLCQKAKRLQENMGEERDRRQNEWRHNQQERLERLRAIVNKNEEIVQRIMGQIEHCEGLRDNARTSEHADEVQGWIDEKQKKVDDIEATSSDIYKSIAEIEQNLGH